MGKLQDSEPKVKFYNCKYVAKAKNMIDKKIYALDQQNQNSAIRTTSNKQKTLLKIQSDRVEVPNNTGFAFNV